jgi:hypothetical protein
MISQVPCIYRWFTHSGTEKRQKMHIHTYINHRITTSYISWSRTAWYYHGNSKSSLLTFFTWRSDLQGGRRVGLRNTSWQASPIWKSTCRSFWRAGRPDMHAVVVFYRRGQKKPSRSRSSLATLLASASWSKGRVGENKMFRALQLSLLREKGGVLRPASSSGCVNGFCSAPYSQLFVFGSLIFSSRA